MGCCVSSRIRNFETLPDNVECLQRSPENVKICADILTKAFAGSATNLPELAFDWCLGPDLQGKSWDSPKRYDSIHWCFQYVVENVFASGKGGVVLCCRTASGEIGGVACLKIHREPGKFGQHKEDHPCVEIATLMRAGGPKGDAKTYVMGNPRMKALEGALKKLHVTNLHVYVWAVAVSTSAQGQGIGGKLMRAAASIADSEGLASYLDCCGPKNPRIYEKYGFAVVGEESLETEDGDKFEHPYFGMVRPANPTKS
jgi:ribosomal protein S18 acetylase RimI-like enzyme